MVKITVAAVARRLIEQVRSRLAPSSEMGVAEVLVRLGEQDLGPRVFQRPEPNLLPVVDYLDECLAEVAVFDPIIARAVGELRPDLRWLQSKAYNDALLGTGFIQNYGWCEIIGPNGFFPGNDFLMGLLMLGPNQHYPDHLHPAPELYWPLTSHTEWRKGDEPLTPKAAGTVIWHPPHIVHATRTGLTPLLAFWSWTRATATPARLL